MTPAKLFARAVYSVGVAFVWLWCAGATFVPVQIALGAVHRGRLEDIAIAIAIGIAIATVAYGYPLLVAGRYERAVGGRAWFRPPTIGG